MIEHRRRAECSVECRVKLHFSLEARAIDQLFPEASVSFVMLPPPEVTRDDFMASPVSQLAVLAYVCCAVNPKRIFEFGTYIGSATRVMAMNTSASITTLDLDAESRSNLFGKEFLYTSGSSFLGTLEADRIEQCFGDTRAFDYAPYLGRMDLVFVDANHTYPFVKNDSEWAIKLVHESGIIVWDDYIFTDEHPECSGVAEYLNECSKIFPCYQIQGSRLAIGFPGALRR